MTIKSGIYSGIRSGISNGINAGWALQPIHDLDFRRPVAQEFPATAAALATLVGDSAAAPDYIWLCDEASGNLTDEIAGEVLTANGTPAYRRPAVGLWDGASYSNGYAIECNDTSTEFDAASSSVMDFDNESFAFLMVFRARPAASTTRYPVRKRASAAGYYFRLNTNGSLWFLTQDDATNQQIAIEGGNYSDHAWHVAIGGRHHGDDITHIYTDQGSATDAVPSWTGSASNAETMVFADVSGDQIQYKYLAAFSGAAAEALLDLGATAVSNFWKVGADPSGKLTTQTRAGTVAVPISATEVATFADDQLPIGYHSALNAGAGGLGLYCNNAVTNEVVYSEDYTISDWNVGLNLTAADSQALGPDGFRSASSLTATAAGGRVETGTISAVANDETWTYSVWVKRNQGSDVAGSIQIRDVGNATSYSQAFTATDTWQLVTITATLPASGVTTARVRVYIDTDTESIYTWGHQFNLGAGRGAYAKTWGASTSLTECLYESTNKIPTEEGRVDISYVTTISGNGENKYAWDTEELTDRRAAWIDIINNQFEAQYRDNLDAVWFSTGAAGPGPAIDTLYSDVARWDVDAGSFPEGASVTATRHINGTQIGTDDTDTSSVEEALRDITVGAAFVANLALDGFIERVRVYDGVGEEPT